MTLKEETMPLFIRTSVLLSINFCRGWLKYRAGLPCVSLVNSVDV